MKTKEQIQEWLSSHALLEQDAYYINGYLRAKLGDKDDHTFKFRTIKDGDFLTIAEIFIKWFESEEPRNIIIHDWKTKSEKKIEFLEKIVKYQDELIESKSELIKVYSDIQRICDKVMISECKKRRK